MIRSLNLPLVAQTLDTSCGAACLDSAVRHFRGDSPGEMVLAQALGTLTLGYTPPENVVRVARDLGFQCHLREGATPDELQAEFSSNAVLIVTWWFEDSGHYSMVENLDSERVVLMDPWEARERRYLTLPLAEFVPLWQSRGSKVIRVYDTHR